MAVVKQARVAASAVALQTGAAAGFAVTAVEAPACEARRGYLARRDREGGTAVSSSLSRP